MAHSREFVVIVGGASNTFNGYGHVDQSGKYHGEPPPADTSPAAIGKYLKGDPAHPAADPQVTPTGTHDLYWANFVYAAVKLVELRGRVPDAINPARGDIVTFLVHLPAYARGLDPSSPPGDRQAWDWDASPYNFKHRNSPYVNANPYNPRFRRQDQGVVIPAPYPPRNRTTSSTTPPAFSIAESSINHEILMRTTSDVDAAGKPEPDGGFPKRPHDDATYIDAITDIPDRLVYGAKRGDHPPVTGVAPLLGVNVKVLFTRSAQDIFDYLGTGAWSGRRRLSMWELVDEEHMSRGAVKDCTWAGQALVRRGKPRPPDWSKDPAVDRTKVKIRRLDYIGHSGFDIIYLEYGMTNNKGVEPGAERSILGPDLVAALKPQLFTPDAQIYLWGCFLGVTLAPRLAPLLSQPASVRACEGFTLFTRLLNAERNLPEPADPVNFGWIFA